MVPFPPCSTSSVVLAARQKIITAGQHDAQPKLPISQTHFPRILVTKIFIRPAGKLFPHAKHYLG
jgi:hypothetical protein